MARKATADYGGIQPLAPMCGFVALDAKRDAVVNIVSRFGEIGPRLDVMGFEFTAALAAFLTGVVTSSQYSLMPLLVFVATNSGKSSTLLPLVSWVLFAALEVWSVAPLVGLGSALDTVNQSSAFVGRRPRFAGAIACLLCFLFGPVSAIFRAKLAPSARRCSKFLATISAGVDNGWVLAGTATVDTFTLCESARCRFECFAASGASHKALSLLGFTAEHVTALAGARCLSAMRQPLGVGLVLFTAYWTRSSYRLAHVAS